MFFGGLTIAINGFSMVFYFATIAFNGFRWFRTIGQVDSESERTCLFELLPIFQLQIAE